MFVIFNSTCLVKPKCTLAYCKKLNDSPFHIPEACSLTCQFFEAVSARLLVQKLAKLLRKTGTQRRVHLFSGRPEIQQLMHFASGKSGVQGIEVSDNFAKIRRKETLTKKGIWNIYGSWFLELDLDRNVVRLDLGDFEQMVVPVYRNRSEILGRLQVVFVFHRY